MDEIEKEILAWITAVDVNMNRVNDEETAASIAYYFRSKIREMAGEIKAAYHSKGKTVRGSITLAEIVDEIAGRYAGNK